MQSLEQLKTKRAVDVLIVNPGSLPDVYQGLANQYSAIEPPSLAALFATYLRLKGQTVDILDAPAFALGPQATAKAIHQGFDAKLVVLSVYGFQPSASTQNMPAAGAIARALKKLNPKNLILMTGTHPAALPEKTLTEEAIDFVCDREGPETIFKVAAALKSGTRDFTEVPSLWYRAHGKISNNPESTLLQNLDSEMPEGAWDLLPMNRYRAHNWHAFDDLTQRQPYVSLHTSLGCPFKCSFCCINAPFGQPSYRTWKPETVVKDIDRLVTQYGVRNIKFVDEMFVLKKDHVLGLCDLLIERNYDLNIWAYARVDTVKDEYLAKMRQAGIRWLALGIESGSKHVRDGVEKGRFGTDDILKVVRKIQAAGIYVIGNYIFGLPDDNYSSMQDTLDLAIEANCEFANFYSAMAYPGSKLYSFAQISGWALPESWIGYSQHSFETLPLRTNFLTSAEVLKFRDDAFQTYFTHPRYLALVKSKFGDQVVKHINDMTRVKLARKIFGDDKNAHVATTLSNHSTV